MAKYEKQVEQKAAYPIPISLYNCYIQDSELLLIYSVSHASLSCNSCTKIEGWPLVNPRRACARVTVVAVCVYPSVTALAVHLNMEPTILTGFS